MNLILTFHVKKHYCNIIIILTNFIYLYINFVTHNIDLNVDLFCCVLPLNILMSIVN